MKYRNDPIAFEAGDVSQELPSAGISPWKTIFRFGRWYLVGTIAGSIGATLIAVGVSMSIVRLLYPESSADLGDTPVEWIWLFWAIPFLGMLFGVILSNRRRDVSPAGVSADREILASCRVMLRRVMIFQLINAFIGLLGFALFHWIVTGVTIFVIASILRLRPSVQITLNIGIAILAFPEWSLFAWSDELFGAVFFLVKLVTLVLVCCVLWVLLKVVEREENKASGQRS